MSAINFSSEINMATKRRARRARAAKAKTSATAVAVKDNIVETGHNIWLAGLGALSRTQSEGPRIFQELVAEGAEFDKRARTASKQMLDSALKQVRGAVDSRMESVRDRTSETWENIEQIFQSRVQRALQQLGVPTADEIHMLTHKVDQLTRSVRSLGNKRETRSSITRKARPQAEHTGAVV